MTQKQQVLVSAKEAADILHEDPRSIQRKAKAGTIPAAAKLPGVRGAYVFDLDVIQAIARQRHADAAAKRSAVAS